MGKFGDDIINSLNALHKGGIILYPTDTIWGIGCDATNAAAVKKIYLLKKREEKKSMIILLQHENDISKYVLDPSKTLVDFLSLQKTPTTAIFKDAINLPKVLVNDDGSIAIRLVKDDFCQLLIGKLNAPIVSTSANISGDRPPGFFEEVNGIIKNGVDYIVQHRQHELRPQKVSSIIKLNSNGEIENIR